MCKRCKINRELIQTQIKHSKEKKKYWPVFVRETKCYKLRMQKDTAASTVKIY